MNTLCKWCDGDWDVDETGLCKSCRKKKPRIEAALADNWKEAHESTGTFDDSIGTTDILAFSWAYKLSGELLNEANYKAASRRLPKEYLTFWNVAHWTTSYRMLGIQIWDAEKEQPTPAWDIYEDLRDQMARYPVLDEQLYSDLQWEDLSSAIESHFRWELEERIEALAEEFGRENPPLKTIIPSDWIIQVASHPIAENQGWNSSEDISKGDMEAVIDDLARRWLQPFLPLDAPSTLQMKRSIDLTEKLL